MWRAILAAGRDGGRGGIAQEEADMLFDMFAESFREEVAVGAYGHTPLRQRGPA